MHARIRTARLEALLQSRLKAAYCVARAHQFSLFLDATVSRTIKALSLQALAVWRFRGYWDGFDLYSKSQSDRHKQHVNTAQWNMCICMQTSSCVVCRFPRFNPQQRATRTICERLTHWKTIEPVQEITNTSKSKGMQDVVEMFHKLV